MRGVAPRRRHGNGTCPRRPRAKVLRGRADIHSVNTARSDVAEGGTAGKSPALEHMLGALLEESGATAAALCLLQGEALELAADRGLSAAGREQLRSLSDGDAWA